MKTISGDCHLCSEFKELTFEHVPPRAASNDKPILIQKHDHLFNRKSHVFGKSIRSNKGAGGYYFCKECNNNTGTWYARDFVDFVKQGEEKFLNLDVVERFTMAGYTFKPLNVLKQILTMFLAIEHGGFLRKDKDLINFLLDKDCKILPDKYQVYIYNTVSNKKRMYGVQWHSRNGIMCTYSEITFSPFGYFLTVDSKPPIPTMANITDFKQFNFSEVKSAQLPMFFLKTEKMHLGQYE